VLSRYRRLLARRVGPVAARLVARTWRIRVLREDGWQSVTAGGRPYVLLCWHDALLPVMWHHRNRGIAAVVSEARDGQYLAAFAASLGYGLIRGSSTRGGRRALRAAIRALEEGTPVGITPDGPRGPPRIPKPGAVTAAARAGAVILPVHAEARPAWRARSWDRFLVPAPFATVRVAYGEPFEVAMGRVAEEAALMRAARELDQAARLTAWPDGGAIHTG
jgi:lysophospholipid acyltransferase (LPLAT)-like uncharacterized protein